jgi:hypothetical protein
MRAVVAAAAVIGFLVAAGPAQAGAPTSLVLWSGGQGPGDPATGVLVKTNGSAQLLAPVNTATGTVKVVKTFTPSPSQLAAIRAAAKGALTGQAVAISPVVDGFYSTATVKVGATTRSLLGNNALPPKLEALLGSVVSAVPASASGARAILERPLARTAAHPDTAACASGAPPPTRVARELTLKQAAQLGILKLTSKGGFNGDAMAVDGSFKDVPAPTVVRLDIELVSDAPGIEKQFEAQVEKQLAGYKINSGPLKNQPVRFDLNVVRRGSAGTSPRACFHELAISNDKNLRDGVSGLGPGPESGELNGVDRTAWTHEVMHLAGLDDRYDDYFVYGGGKKAAKMPEVGLEGTALTAELTKLGINPKNGYLTSRPHKGYAGNLMASDTGKLNQADLKHFAQLGQDTLIIHSKPGDLLTSKAGDQQNVVNGQSFDMVLRRGGPPAHLDGMTVYCADLSRHIPGKGIVYDVLGPADELGNPAMAALARVMEVVNSRERASFTGVPAGAQDAIWRITDDSPPGAAARAILEEAGVPTDTDTVKFNAPHFGNPNAGSPNTGAVTPGAALPPLDLGAAPPRVRAPRPRLRNAAMLPRTSRRARRLLLTLQVTFAAGAGDRVTLALERRSGRRFRRVRRLGRRTVGDGLTAVSFVLRGLSPGRYRVRVSASRRQVRFATFAVT